MIQNIKDKRYKKGDKEITCSFTGYRPQKLPWKYDETDPRCLELKRRLDREVEKAYRGGMRHFICGMALGCDMYFCEAVLKLKAKHDDILLEAAIPCEEQSASWNEKQRNRYFSLVSRCDVETMIQTSYTPSCMMRRNQYMVEQAGLLIAVFDGMLGGTMYTVELATRQGVKIITLPPVKDSGLKVSSASYMPKKKSELV
ncbi:SLOG family protein [Papillibacter cinnamivorans]|uniref:Uncharacterized SPBc2 prophage-derived protein YoqJ n=1 Tax=Papillibacter cinnamivorans DSM 12816 TaxID=1122930 RepID=A0A1W1Z2E5_9FIRM|nr:SLOG family protein [Papillibacter cinnamivorans]SMC42625.1 Uncharacterized SPBc2 prophage-derived protein YoqJ [Papillibacter cinnamivorans DSM 12816]